MLFSKSIRQVSICLILLFMSHHSGIAQTWDEWFKQNKTQKKYLGVQLVKLRLYAKLLMDGYGIAQQGLAAIGIFSNTHFEQYNSYFLSRKKASSVVRQYHKCGEIEKWLEAIDKQIIREQNFISNNKSLPSFLHQDFLSFADNVQPDLKQAKKSYVDVLSTDQADMTDKERLDALDKIHAQLNALWSLTNQTTSQHQILIIQYYQNQNDIKQLKKMYRR